jgi:hypothetical protein
MKNYFNLIRFAQRQGLLFYPYNKPPNKVIEKVPPAYTDNEGHRVYKCQFCDLPIAEDEIVDWIKLENKLNYTQNVTLTEQKIRQFISTTSALFNQIVPKLEQFIKGGKKDGNLLSEITMLEAKVNTIPFLEEIKFYEENFGDKYGVRNTGLFNLLQKIKDQQITQGGWEQYLLDQMTTTNFQYIEQELLNSLKEQYANFSVNQEAPVCEECWDKFPVCQDCEEYITDGKQVETLAGDTICQKCLENGDYSPCDECGGIDRADNMHWIEAEGGSYCDSCFEAHQPDYGNYRDRVENEAAGKDYPFQEWFPEGEDRIYLDFEPLYRPNITDKMVIDYLKAYGCEVSNSEYQKGHCLFNGRQFRINKLFERIRKDKRNTAKMNIKNDPKGLEERLKIIDNEIELLTRTFMNSSTRTSAGKSDLQVVISQNIHDIAQMSTGRGWKSCMELGMGSHYDDVFCEVAEGGLIAYLINKDDEDIEQPLARISIKRFENEAGQSLAMPEERVYGNGKPGFYKQVNEWLISRQKALPKGKYERRGGNWSDTYGREYEKVSKQIIKLLKKACGISNWYKISKRYGELYNFIFAAK